MDFSSEPRRVHRMHHPNVIPGIVFCKRKFILLPQQGGILLLISAITQFENGGR